MGTSARTWTDADQALLYTCHLASDLLAGRQMHPSPVAAPFPPRFATDERYLAAGGFTLSIYDAVGDGSYIQDAGFFFATGKAGLAATAGIAAARARSNSKRRKEAARDMVPRWVPQHTGIVTVSDHGIYLRTPQDFFAWNWVTLRSAEVAAFNTVVLAAPTANGRIAHWQFHSMYAELAFLLWATTRYPGHPQLVDQRWLPPNWVRWAREQGQTPALAERLMLGDQTFSPPAESGSD